MLSRSIGSLLTAALLTASAASAQDEVTFKATELRDGLYMIQGVGGFAGGNLGLSIGDDGVVLIDDSMPPFAEKMLEAIAEVTDKPVDFLINTHVHGDHVGNNHVMGERGATIVAHDNIRKRLLEQGIRGQDGFVEVPEEALPVVTFSKDITFHLNGHEAHVFHVHHAHTDGDGVIHFRDADVIHTGDAMFNGLFPFIDLDTGGSLDGYIEAQEKIYALAGDETHIIPGHGPLATKADLGAAVAMLKDAKARIAKLKAEGKSEDEVVELNPLADYHDDWNWGFITTERMTRQVYKGLGE
ncbi:MAG: MBL fold metallo-hydrolase [Xanthomonadales bacterium]|nr:MBL fold metallo-hydrolase [Xanthomonadales bacterium]